MLCDIQSSLELHHFHDLNNPADLMNPVFPWEQPKETKATNKTKLDSWLLRRKKKPQPTLAKIPKPSKRYRDVKQYRKVGLFYIYDLYLYLYIEHSMNNIFIFMYVAK